MSHLYISIALTKSHSIAGSFTSTCDSAALSCAPTSVRKPSISANTYMYAGG